MRRTLLAYGAVALAVGVSACGDVPVPTAPTQPEATGPAPAKDDPSVRGIDRAFARVAREVPGFGGMYRAADGSAVLYLKDPAQGSAARAALARAGHLSATASVQVRAAASDYLELTEWRGRIRSRPTSTSSALSFVDIDESNNRIRVGVVPGTPHATVEEELVALGIPRSAIEVEDAERIRFLATLRDRIRPTRGGIQIVWPDTANQLFVCTLGFNVRVPHHEGEYFVTNSHCSGAQGGVQHTPFYQSLPGAANLVAREVADPEYFTEGCYPHRRCRFSDAALAKYEDGVEVAFGTIARTTLRGLTAGSLTIDPVREYFYVGDRRPFSVVGQTLDKVGRTTGWTVGTVGLTCVDVFVNETDFAMLCQDAVFSGNLGGDSGSPVFESMSPGSDQVTLYGILWGGGTSSFGPIYIFSPLENIEFELGPLQVTLDE